MPIDYDAAPSLTGFIGDDGFAAAVLATVERVCIAGTTAFASPITPLSAYFDTYRIAAVHDFHRLAAYVAAHRRACPDTTRSMTDIVEAAVLADIKAIYAVPNPSDARFRLRDEVNTQWSRPTTLVETLYLNLARTKYDGRFEIACHKRPGLVPQTPIVRCEVLFPAIYTAVAEYLVNNVPGRVFSAGTDIVADAALAEYTAKHDGVIRADRLNLDVLDVEHAVRELNAQITGVCAPCDIPLLNLDAPRADGWFTSSDYPLSDNALLTATGAYYLIGRARELACTCESYSVDKDEPDETR